MFEFTALIETFGKNSLGYETYLEIPKSVFEQLLPLTNDKRILCYINDATPLPRAMSPKGDFHYILLNKEVVKKLLLSIGDEVHIKIEPDISKYGMPISEEMQEVLFADPDGAFLFEKLTPGKQRSLLHVINKIKNSNSRIDKSFVILEHLKRQKGSLDFKILNEDFKKFRANRAL